MRNCHRCAGLQVGPSRGRNAMAVLPPQSFQRAFRHMRVLALK